ncbi:uncharacterized protein LOC130441437 [Diorhabda sublineata]|uniref:uncharacterized protein LOC130441437 n=1 Tax=Diorhabda sublineata TaxID=1163346 RepID=UPI0024E0628B|nr:uncharacterized protein LOC130441437 [Diorhabda sublineata]
MDFISSDVLNKYENIINEINQEYEKNKQLAKELEKENDSILIHKLIRTKSIEKLSLVKVRIFSDVIELLTLYSEEIRESVNQLSVEKHRKFYFVEIYISEEFFKKLRKEDWFINISVQNGNFRICKCVKLKKTTVCEILLVPDNVIECSVDVDLINITNEWICVKLDHIDIDISYHFHKFKQKLKFPQIDNILRLNQLYNKEFDSKQLKEIPFLSYELKFSDLNERKFIEMILQNAYHSLDIELFADIQNDNKKDFVVQIRAWFSKIEITYNRKDTLRLKSDFVNLELLKKYFIKTLHKDNEGERSTALDEVKNYLVINPQDAINLYIKLRKLSGKFTI